MPREGQDVVEAPELLEEMYPEEYGKAEEDEEKRIDRREQNRNDVETVMRSDAGRRFIWRLLGWTHIHQTSFTKNQVTFFKEGQRDVGLKMLGALNDASPDYFPDLIKENGGLGLPDPPD